MKMIIQSVIFLLFSFFIFGCTNSVYSTKVNQPIRNGLVYTLPKTVLNITITYTLVENKEYINGIETKNLSTVFINKPIEVVPITISDLKNSFVLTGDDITNNIFLDSNFDFKFNQHGSLSSIDSDIKNNSVNTVQSLFSAGIKVATMVAPAGNANAIPNEPMSEINKSIDDIYKELGKLIGNSDPKNNAKIEQLKSRLTSAYNLIEMYKEKNKSIKSETDFKYILTLDTEEFSYDDTNEVYYKEILPNNLIDGKSSYQMPKVTIKLSEKRFNKNSINIFSNDSLFKGVFYRIGKPVLTQIFVGSGVTEIFHDYILFPQFGTTGIVNLDSKGMSDKKTSMSFNSSNGSLNEYKVASGSSADKVTQSLNTSLTDLQKAIIDIKYDLKIQELEKQKALIDAEKSLEISKKELEEAKKTENKPNK